MFRSTVRRAARWYEPPPWLPQLTADAKASEKHISYDIRIFDELAWRSQPFTFESRWWSQRKNSIELSKAMKSALCLGDEGREYTLVGECLPFPDKEDAPVINEPGKFAKLWWEHTSATPKVLLQLHDEIPPLLWLPIKPQLESIRKVLKEFVEVDAEHVKRHLDDVEKLQNKLESRHKEQFGGDLADFKMKDEYMAQMRARNPADLRLEYPNNFHMHIGHLEHFRFAEDRWVKENPFVFGWPMLLSDGNEHLEGTSSRCAAFRTLHSKSLIMLHSRVDLQVDPKLIVLPEKDGLSNLRKEPLDDAMLEVPLYATVNYPTNTRLSGGAAFVNRFNKACGTSYPGDTPVDVLAALAIEQTHKSVADLRSQLEFYIQAVAKKQPEDRVSRLHPSLTAANRVVGQLAHTILHLALVEDPEWEKQVWVRNHASVHPMIRIACAKGANILQREDLIRKQIEAEEAQIASSTSPDPDAIRCKELLEVCLEGLENNTDSEQKK